MDELAKCFGAGSFGLMLGGIVGYLIRLMIDQRLRKELEDHKHTLAMLGKRLDFLHQERGKACLTLVRLVKAAKCHVKRLVDPMQLGPVNQEEACKDAHVACGELHNFIADNSFLFPKPLEDRMLKTRTALWSVLDPATTVLGDAMTKRKSSFDNPAFCELSRELRAEFEPLEAALIAEIRSLLGAADDKAEK